MPKEMGSLSDRYGGCETTEEFLELWKQYPEAPLHFKMRNFNTITGDEYTRRYGPNRSNMTISLEVRGVLKDDLEHIWLDKPELQKILPQSVFQELAKLDTEGIYFGDIVSLGPLIAKGTGRSVSFTRQIGSGDPESTDYEHFGPFYPQEEFENLNQETLKEQLESSVHMSIYGFASLEDLLESL